jgi:YVTN family beta-propeller protein
VISDRTNTIVATIHVGSSPRGVAYYSGKREVFVANFGSSNVSVISDRTNTVVASVVVGSAPWGAMYEPTAAQVFVSDSNSTNVSVINDSSNAVLATVSVGLAPEGLAYDPTLHEVFVATSGTNSLVAILDNQIHDCPKCHKSPIGVLTSAPVGPDPTAVAFDPVLRELFVTDQTAAAVTIVSPTTPI